MIEVGRVLEGRERDLAIRAFMGWRIGQALLKPEPRPELRLEAWLGERANNKPMQRLTRCRKRYG